MRGKLWRRTTAAALALLIVSGSVPIQPLSQVFEDIAITASAMRTTVDLSTLADNYTAQDGDVLTGSTSGTVTIADNANITLNNATINGGIVCEGSATITLVGTNSVTGAYLKAGIQIGGSGTALTIKGDGSLTANGGYWSAGIGLSAIFNYDNNVSSGDIIIEGGTITATGGHWGAGIGTGVIKNTNNDNSTSVQFGNVTIKGGTVTATGGNSGDGIGKGYSYPGPSITFGIVTIYDGIDMVDASSIKNSESIVYMHDEEDVTATASDYFTINEDGNRRIITQKDDTDYNVTIADDIEHGTLTGAATAKYGEKVTITATPDLGYRLSRLVVKDAQNNDVESTGNSFFMPKGGVTVSAVFEQGVHGTTEFKLRYSTGPRPEDEQYESFYNGVTTVNLQQGQSYEILKYDEYSYTNFLLDNDTYNATIPYSGGTGTFTYANGTNFGVDYNGESGFYDITMTDVGNGKWSASVLKTVGVIDNIPDQTYTGSEITPEPLVLAGSLNLTKGTDYEYSYEDNINVGTAKVIVTFKGDYASLGSVEKEFNIRRGIIIDDGITNGTVSVDNATVAVGETVTLTVTPDTGYVVKSVKVGDDEITPVDGVYSFIMPDEDVTVTAEFLLDLTVTPAENLVYTGEAQNLVKGDIPEGTKFSFEDPNDVDSEPKWLDTAEATKAGTYTVYYKGDGVNYSDEIKSFEVTIAKADFTVTPAENLVYTGEAQKLVNESSVADGAVVNYALKQEPEIVTDNGGEIYVDSFKKGTVYKAETMSRIYFPKGYAMIFGDTTYTVSETYNRVGFFYSESDGYRIEYYDYEAECAVNETFDLGENNNGVIVTDVDTENKTFTVEPVNTNDLSNVDKLNWSETIPEATKAGTYTVYYKGDGVNYSDEIKSFDVTIARADLPVTPAENLVYTGEAQNLVDGDVPEGTKFSFEDPNDAETEPNWLDTAEATKAGTYTVYYKGDGVNYSDEIKSFDVTIARADLPVTVTGYEGTFDGNAHGITVDVGNSDAVVYYAKTAINADNYAEIGSTVNPSFTNAGSYRVYYYVTTGNYDPDPVSGSKLVTIKKADAPALTDDQKPTPVDKLVYTGEDQDLVVAPTSIPDGYSIRYSINGGAWISTLPTAVEAGTYTVAYKYVENTNFKDIAGETFTITVKDKYTEPMWVWADDYSSATATFIKNDNSSEPIILDAEVTSEVVSEPTYTEYGKTVYIATVKLEGKTYTYRKPVITAMLSLTHVEAVPATCDEAGNIEYWFDAENEKYFADDKGETEITMADTIVAPIDHAYGEAQWIWNAENAATATFKCANCDDEQTINAVVTAEVTAPTYTKNGKTVYTATVNFDGKTYTDTLTVTIGKKAYTAPTISYLKGDGAVKLSWNAIEGAERYAIAGFIDGKWKLLNRTEDTSYILENLNPGEQYKVAVVAMFDGEYIMDFSNAITVTPKPAVASVYPKITEIEYNEQYHQFKLNWTEVPNAQNYGIAVYLAGKWKIQTQSIPAGTTSYTSPKLKAGQTYKMIVCAKVNGKWDLSALSSRAFEVTVK